MRRVTQIDGWEILDSRGLPTVLARCRLDDGTEGTASVPSGRSTGKWEAVERRDGDPSRYDGAGCLAAVAGLRGEISTSLSGRRFADQQAFDSALVEIDGSADKSRLGSNTLLAASLAFARATARAEEVPLWQHFSQLTGERPALPVLTVNLFSGGKHAGGQVPVQDTLVVTRAARSIAEGLAQVRSVFGAAAELIRVRYGARLLTADEGGLAPEFGSVEEMFECAVDAVEAAGLAASQMALAVDVAASHFASESGYSIGSGGPVDAEAMIGLIAGWVSNYPIISVEDGLGEDDWEHWPHLCEAISAQALVVGDDLLCTNPTRVARAVDAHAVDTLLLKVNQIGTLTEASEALGLARAAGWKVVASARSGETEDTWLADLAVGWSADYIKVGSVTQSERLAKYNRLLIIEAESGLAIGDS